MINRSNDLIVILIVGLLTIFESTAQNINSESTAKNYLKTHITQLDPIEGEYDVDWSCNYDTPMGHWEYPHDTFKIWIIKHSGNYTIYNNSDGYFHKSDVLSIKPIGETNAYTFYYSTTPSRIYLQNNNHFVARFQLNNQSANVFRGQSTAASVKIAPTYDCIKVYPTASMYAEEQSRIARQAQQEQQEQPREWSGSGFALKEGYVITNCHVIEDAKSIIVRGIKGDFSKSYKAIVVGNDKNCDLALLKIEDVTFQGFGAIPYSIPTSIADVGEDVYVLGYPLTSTMGDEIKLTNGIISSKTGYQGDVSLYQISAPIQPGNSGGPLFNKKGNIIGVVSAKHAGAENVGYAIKSSYLRNLIESCASASIIPTNNTVSTLPLTGKVKAEKNFVFYIQCSSSTNMSSMSSASRVINNPYVGSDNLNDEGNNTLTKISKVEITPSYTSISFTLRNYVWCSISSDTYIKVGDKKYYLTRNEGIECSPNRTYPTRVGFDGYSLIECTFYFPPIPSNSITLDFIEPNSRWQFFNVSLTN